MCECVEEEESSLPYGTSGWRGSNKLVLEGPLHHHRYRLWRCLSPPSLGNLSPSRGTGREESAVGCEAVNPMGIFMNVDTRPGAHKYGHIYFLNMPIFMNVDTRPGAKTRIDTFPRTIYTYSGIFFIGIRTLCDSVTRGYGDHSPLTIHTYMHTFRLKRGLTPFPRRYIHAYIPHIHT